MRSYNFCGGSALRIEVGIMMLILLMSVVGIAQTAAVLPDMPQEPQTSGRFEANGSNAQATEQNLHGTSGIDDNNALQLSLSYLKDHSSEWGIQNPVEEFQLQSVFHDQFGILHVRLNQEYKGVHVFGKQLIVHLNSNGSLRLITGDYKAGINISTNHKLTGQEAKNKVIKKFPGPVTEAPSPKLMLFPKDDGNVVLVHQVKIHDDETPRSIVAFVDADNGVIIFNYDNIQTLSPSGGMDKGQNSVKGARPTPTPTPIPTPKIGTGNSLYSGQVQIPTSFDGTKYYLIDLIRVNMQTNNMNQKSNGYGKVFTDPDNTWGNSTIADSANAGVDAHYGAVMTFDYYKNVHGRNGIYNDGKGTLSRVHYKRNYVNAFWSDSCRCMTYGDGDGFQASPLVSLDVAAHEMTHGVTSATANLIYSGESGGLNEAMSDIFGTAVEFYAFSQGAQTTPDYLIGEDVWTPGTDGDALRYMDDPTKDGSSIDNYANYYNGLNVHLSSGIANKAFYLLAKGGPGVEPIGREKAEQIFYHTLTGYMINSESFSMARADTIIAATDLYGGPEVSEVQSVKDAWSAVGVI
jgi:zinc metalloprotease ZmpA